MKKALKIFGWVLAVAVIFTVTQYATFKELGIAEWTFLKEVFTAPTVALLGTFILWKYVIVVGALLFVGVVGIIKLCQKIRKNRKPRQPKQRPVPKPPKPTLVTSKPTNHVQAPQGKFIRKS